MMIMALHAGVKIFTAQGMYYMQYVVVQDVEVVCHSKLNSRSRLQTTIGVDEGKRIPTSVKI